jgi:hypothetical protein
MGTNAGTMGKRNRATRQPGKPDESAERNTGVAEQTGAGASQPGSDSAEAQRNESRKNRSAKAARATIEIDTQEAEAVKSAPKRSRRKRRSTPESQESSRQAADFLMSAVETFAVAEFGEEARFNDREKFMIHDPLARLVERYSNLADRYTGLIDPIMVIVGAGLFAVRLGNIAEERNPKHNVTPQEQKASEPPAPGVAPEYPPSSNGHNPAENPQAMIPNQPYRGDLFRPPEI